MVTVFCCTAPFIHILLDKKSPQFDLLDAQLESKELTQANYEAAVEQLKESEKYFGFTNKRKFWYAIGKPIAMTYVSFMLLFLSGYVNDPKVSGIANISGILFFSISMYFVVWTFWDRQDFPATAYFVSIGVISIASTFLALKYLKHQTMIYEYLIENIRKLTGFIQRDVRTKYVNESDRKEYTKDVVNVVKSLK